MSPADSLKQERKVTASWGGLLRSRAELEHFPSPSLSGQGEGTWFFLSLLYLPLLLLAFCARGW